MAQPRIKIINHLQVRDGVASSSEAAIKGKVAEIERMIRNAIDTPPALSGQYSREFNFLRNVAITALRQLGP